MADVDRLKRINDAEGHEAGDEAIRSRRERDPQTHPRRRPPLPLGRRRVPGGRCRKSPLELVTHASRRCATASPRRRGITLHSLVGRRGVREADDAGRRDPRSGSPTMYVRAERQRRQVGRDRRQPQVSETDTKQACSATSASSFTTANHTRCASSPPSAPSPPTARCPATVQRGIFSPRTSSIWRTIGMSCQVAIVETMPSAAPRAVRPARWT